MKNTSKRRSFIRKLFGTSVALGALPMVGQTQPSLNGRFAHVVFFWLKSNQAADVKRFEEGTRNFLSQVEVIKSIHLGQPAGTPRDVVDNSYSVCLIVTFDSKEDQDIYQKHSAHLQYIEDMKHMWTKVQVFDSWGFA